MILEVNSAQLTLYTFPDNDLVFFSGALLISLMITRSGEYYLGSSELFSSIVNLS